MAQLWNIGYGSGGVGIATIGLQINASYGENVGNLLDYVLTNNNSPAVVQAVNLASGNNTFTTTTCPALATAGGVAIVPPLTSGATLSLKGITADTGIAINGAVPTVLTFANGAPPSQFVLTSNGTVNGVLLVFF